MKKNIPGLIAAGVAIAALAALAGCAPSGTDQGSGTTQTIYLVVLIVLMVAMFYFMMVRPMRQREKRRNEMVSDLKKGDRVITAGGMYGMIESIDEESVVLKVESGATVRVTKSGILGRSKELTGS